MDLLVWISLHMLITWVVPDNWYTFQVDRPNRHILTEKKLVCSILIFFAVCFWYLLVCLIDVIVCAAILFVHVNNF